MVTFRLEQEGARASLLLPGDVRAGDTVTGLLDVGTEKAPLDEAVRSRIDALVVEAAGSRATIGSGHLTLTVPEGAEEVEVTLLDPSGTALAAIGAAVAPAVAADPGEPSCELPAYGQSGGLLALGGRFDGDAATTWVRVGGELLPVWAESPRRVIVRAPGGTGPFEIEVRDGGWSCRTEGHLVAVRWNPRSTAAARGETVRVAVRVGGLSGLASSDLASSPRPVVDLWTWTLAHPHTRVHHSVEVASLERDVWVTELPVVAGHYGVFKTLARLSQP